MIEVLNLIDGYFVGALDGRVLDDFNPATGHLIATQPRSSAADVAAAVASSQKAFKEWSNVPVAVRAQYLEDIAKGIESQFDEFVRLESMDTGKPISLACSVDIPRAVNNFRFFAQAVLHQESPSTEMPGAINYTQRMAIGAAALITPWNLPIYLLSWKLAPALAMGCTVVCKPSELSPLTAHALAKVIVKAGLPPGVVNFVFGTGKEAGAPLVSSPGIDAVSFTGGTVTGRNVATAASQSFKKLSLELGGKNASIVFADCDFGETVKGVVRSSFLNSGQICLCGSRILVERSLFETFLSAFVENVKKLTVGDPAQSWMGSVISPDHLDKIESYVKLAKEEGGKILCGGRRPQNLPEQFTKGSFFEPTVITGVSVESRCATEEIFGPIVTVHPFDTEAEAVDIHNSVRYGLAGTVWTSNIGRGHRVAHKMHTGMVWVNTWLKRDLRVPFGGVKDSGIGKEGGMRSLEFFSEMKNICVEYGN